MPNIQIKDVPAETHAVLARRAAASGKSLQAFLLGELIEFASHPTLDEVFDDIERRGGGGSMTAEDAVKLIREVREEHESDRRERDDPALG